MVPSTLINEITQSEGQKRVTDSSNYAQNQQVVPNESGDHPHHESSTDNQSLQSLPGGANAPHHPIAEFLYQLTKMLTDNNDEIVEWTNGKIRVHYPDRLEGEVLHKYFRHSKFASFQRQLNYFGFRKIAGKGKMSPCSYVNDAATSDLGSLLLIKRKTNGCAARKAAMAQRSANMPGQMTMGLHGGLQVPADYFTQTLVNNSLAPQNFVYPGMMFADPQHQAALQQLALQHHALQQNAQNQKANMGIGTFAGDPMSLMSQKLSPQDLDGFSKRASIGGSLEQLHHLNAARSSALNLAGFGLSAGSMGSMASLASINAMLAPQNSMPTAQSPMPPPLSTSMPATVAMNATAAANAAASSQANNVFESNSALNAFVGSSNTQGDPKTGLAVSSTATSAAQPSGSAAGSYCSGTSIQYPGSALQQRLSGSNLLRSLPSAGTMFPDSLSSASLSGLLPGVTGMSSNRLSSMLSLGSFFSRDPSMADLLPGASNVNLSSIGGSGQFSNGFNSSMGYNNGFNSGALGSTTLVPLTGGSSQFDFIGASAALQSLANASGPASSLMGALSGSSGQAVANSAKPPSST